MLSSGMISLSTSAWNTTLSVLVSPTLITPSTPALRYALPSTRKSPLICTSLSNVESPSTCNVPLNVVLPLTVVLSVTYKSLCKCVSNSTSNVSYTYVASSTSRVPLSVVLPLTVRSLPIVVSISTFTDPLALTSCTNNCDHCCMLVPRLYVNPGRGMKSLSISAVNMMLSSFVAPTCTVLGYTPSVAKCTSPSARKSPITYASFSTAIAALKYVCPSTLNPPSNLTSSSTCNCPVIVSPLALTKCV